MRLKYNFKPCPLCANEKIYVYIALNPAADFLKEEGKDVPECCYIKCQVCGLQKFVVTAVDNIKQLEAEWNSRRLYKETPDDPVRCPEKWTFE